MSDQSGQLRFRYRTLWLVMGWALVLAIVYLSLTPHPIEIQVEEGDKMGHCLAYGTLMLWFAQLYDTTKARCLLAVGWVALGGGLEFRQIFCEARLLRCVCVRVCADVYRRGLIRACGCGGRCVRRLYRMGARSAAPL